jgi:hypothetical protein
MQFGKIVGITGQAASEGLTSGAPNKGILLTGANTRIHATDIYGNTFHFDHDARIGVSILPIRIASCQLVENGPAYLLY